MSRFSRQKFTLRAAARQLELGRRTLLMGILNVTPDSFADGGLHFDPDRAAARARRIADEGADILDIGAESTRPGADGVSADEELARLLPVLDRLAGSYPLPISIDTRKAAVAREAIERGAVIVNDVTGLSGDPEMAGLVSRSGAAVVLMHMRGRPATMQQEPFSPDIMQELEDWASEAVARARNAGVSSDSIILDPGIGFGKSAGQNLEILRHLDRLASAGFPILVGTSRKSFIGAVLEDPARDRIWGTAATVAAAVVFGAHIVRLHDVAPMRDVVRIADAVIGSHPEA